MEKLNSLIQTAHQLRAPGGCPWDAEQDHRSLVQYLLEETYELIDAIE
jgi:XTP/dITP diphosphohydrolase